MMRRLRRTHSPTFTATVALAAIRGDQTLSELTQPCDVPPNQSQQWQEPLLAGVTEGFDRGGEEGGRIGERRDRVACADRATDAGE